jgi:hypothetical protein
MFSSNKKEGQIYLWRSTIGLKNKSVPFLYRKISEMEKSIPFLKEEFSDFLPEISESCRIISRQLGIDPDNTSLQKLHSAVSSGGSDISVASKDGTTCSSLFNSFTVESNPMWKQA